MASLTALIQSLSVGRSQLTAHQHRLAFAVTHLFGKPNATTGTKMLVRDGVRIWRARRNEYAESDVSKGR